MNTVNRSLELHRYHEAAQTLWDFVWHEFCDWYLEVKKLRFREGSGVDSHWQAALTIYEASLRLLHPFMPFVTEELWQRLIHGDAANDKQPKSVSITAFPMAAASEENSATRLFGLLQEVVTSARELRADNKLDTNRSSMPLSIFIRPAFQLEDLAAIGSLAKLQLKQRQGAIAEHTGLIRSTPDFDLQLHAAAPVAAAQGSDSRARLEKEIESLERLIANSDRQLSDETFLSKAPEKVVATLRGKLAEYREQLAKNKKLLEGLA